MIISRVMTKNPIYINPEMSVSDVQALMGKEKIGKLPVLDKNENLVGIITKKDLIKAAPSSATTLDMYEISYLLSKLRVEKIMEKNVITVQDTEVVEEAARIMADEGIGCLPVMHGNILTGIITEKDLFHAFLEMFGARHPGIRAVFVLDEKPGQIAKLAKAIADLNGNIVSLVTTEGDDIRTRRCTAKVANLTIAQLTEIMQKENAILEDIR